MMKKLKKINLFWVWDREEYEEIEENELYEDDEVFEDLEEDREEENLWQIALDILDDGKNLIILAPVAGIDLKDIDLSFYNQVLTISWVRKRPNFYDEDVFIKNSECYWGKFSRKIILPENLDFEDIKASMENNLLMINIPKLHFQNHNIQIDKIY